MPSAYRLGKRHDGVLVLQGEYTWYEGSMVGHDWRDIPTVDLGQPVLETTKIRQLRESI